MLLLQAAIAVGLCLSPAVFADELTTMLKEIQLTESEKTDNSTVLTPKIEVEGKSIRECFVRIHPGEGVSLAIPSSDGTAIIKRVYLSSKTGGIFLQENDVSRYVNLLGAEDKSVEREKQIEHDFIRQFGYLLRQRHPEDELTLKFFQRYFPVQKEKGFSILGPGDLNAEALLAGVDPMEQIFHFMQKPSEWTGKECNSERCLFDHPKLGSLTLTHPGSAELILDANDLIDPAEEKAPLAPEVTSRSELETSLDALPSDVAKVFVLITHSKCTPCQALKKSDGAWHKFCRLLRRVRSRKVVALMESTEGETIMQSALMGDYGLPGSYPQMLVFERDADGKWQAPQSVAAGDIVSTLKAE